MLGWGLALGLGAAVGFLSGLLGLGGSILLIPLLVSLPPLLGHPPLPPHAVAGISAVQVLAGALTGLLVHARRGGVSARLVAAVGGPAAAAGAVAGWLSGRVPGEALLRLFFLLALAGLLLMFVPRRDDTWRPGDPVRIPLGGAALVGTLVGAVGGLAGAPGAFLYVPLLIYGLGLPTRLVLGSTLGIVLVSALASTVGKAAAGQIPWGDALPVALGAALAAPLGARLSWRVPVAALRRAVALVIAVATWELGVRAW